MNQSGDSKNVKRRRNRGGKGGASEGEASPSSGGVVTESKTQVVGGPGAINSLLDETKTQVNSIYRDVLDGIGEGFHYKSRPSKGEIFATPTVVFLGNHSSGKSTFINYLLNEEELQNTGQAPMDDGFTLISYGENRDEEQEGPAIVNNTKLPYTSLSNIGGVFVERLKMKFLPVPLLRDVTLVDSPGMIDSISEEGRGYDFIEAVRWFASRADYVLFFFDGEKPGTTGETLRVFTQALTGIDHKLLILMNKVDTFRNIGDFVRTYGTLCWNLAKCIKFKDMPFIYTTYVPVEERERLARPAIEDSADAEKAKKSNTETTPANPPSTSVTNSYGSWSLVEFEKARYRVIKKIRNAPSRHADNMITELKKYTEHVLMHAQVITHARSQLAWARMKLWFTTIFLSIFASLGIFLLSFQKDAVQSASDLLLNPYTFLVPVLCFLFILLGGFLYYIPNTLHDKEKILVESLNPIFEFVYAKELIGSAADTYRNIWEEIHPTTKFTIEKFGLLSFPSLAKKQTKRLQDIINDDVENMLNKVHSTLKARNY